MNTQKVYRFKSAGQGFYTWTPCLTVAEPYSETRHELTDATYNRFVRLAHSGRYNLEILPAEYGVCWTLSR